MAESNMSAARKAGLPWRLAECNSASLGGTAGVSDVYAAAIWGADFLFDLAERGVAGINFHTNFQPQGYTPIVYNKENGTYSACPLYYSLLLFKDAGRGKILPTKVTSDGNVTAHSTIGDDKKIRVVVINKDLNQPAEATIITNTDRTDGTVARLVGDSPTEKSGISYAGMTVTNDGSLTHPKLETVKGTSGRFAITIPACSAAVLSINEN